MIKFVDKEFIVENNTECVLVIDVDMHGAWETGYHEQMRYAFPRAYDIYREACLKGNDIVGSSMIIEDSGYKIAILFVKKHRKDLKEKLLKNFSKALADMLQKVPSDLWIYSPILGRKDKAFNELIVEINRQTYLQKNNWFIYKKEF